MKSVRVTFNQRINAEANYSVTTEVLVDEETDAVSAGRKAFAFVADFQKGMLEEANERD